LKETAEPASSGQLMVYGCPSLVDWTLLQVRLKWLLPSRDVMSSVPT
jgi:hypothetical protein